MTIYRNTNGLSGSLLSRAELEPLLHTDIIIMDSVILIPINKARRKAIAFQFFSFSYFTNEKKKLVDCSALF